MSEPTPFVSSPLTTLETVFVEEKRLDRSSRSSARPFVRSSLLPLIRSSVGLFVLSSVYPFIRSTSSRSSVRQFDQWSFRFLLRPPPKLSSLPLLFFFASASTLQFIASFLSELYTT